MMLDIKSAAFAIAGLLTFNVRREKLLQTLNCGVISSRSSILSKFDVHGIIQSRLFCFCFLCFLCSPTIGVLRILEAVLPFMIMMWMLGTLFFWISIAIILGFIRRQLFQSF